MYNHALAGFRKRWKLTPSLVVGGQALGGSPLSFAMGILEIGMFFIALVSSQTHVIHKHMFLLRAHIVEMTANVSDEKIQKSCSKDGIGTKNAPASFEPTKV